MTDRTKRYFTLIVIFLIAFWLRVYRLGDANVWWDEAYSVWLARKAVVRILSITAFDVHPPLYYLLLKGWMIIAGDSEFAVRYLSLIGGLLTIPILVVLGRRLISQRWALVGVLLLALSPLHVWWSQEARMYIFAAGLSSLAFYILLRQVDRSSIRRWIAYTLVVAAALYTLYLAGLFLMAATLTVLILWLAGRVRWRWVLSWVMAQVEVLLLYAPWVGFALPRIRSDSAGSDIGLGMIAELQMMLLSTGLSIGIGQYTLVAAAYGLLLAGILIALIVQRRWKVVAFTAPPLLLPGLVIYGLTIIDLGVYAPNPEARYFLLFMPVAMLIPALGVSLLAQRRRWAGAVLAAILLGLIVWRLPAHYRDRHLADQWKSAVDIINAYAEPGDVVVMVSADRYPLFLYEYEYEQSPAPRPVVTGVPGGEPTLTPENIQVQMNRAVGDAHRVWLVEIESAIQDPERLARQWLDDYGEAVLTADYGHNHLTLYAPDGEPPQLQYQPAVVWEMPLSVYAPGDVFHAGLYTPSGGGGSLQIRHQKSGITIEEFHLENLPNPARHEIVFSVVQAMPHGVYQVIYKENVLATFSIRRSDSLWQPSHIANQIDASFDGGIRLVGYELSPARPVPGDTLTLDLFWEASSPVDESYTVFVHLIGPYNPATDNPLWGQHDGLPVDGHYPLDRWPAGLLIRDRHVLTFEQNAPPGAYQLLVGLYDPLTGTRLPLPGYENDAFPIVVFDLP